jgi:hypothetical protein
MISEQIEKIKSEYTDKYVIVRSEKPELARFTNYVGQVKTVNMSGRALVQFDDFNLNTGWYDIDLDYLKVVDKPLPKKGPPPKKEPAMKRGAVPKEGQKPAARQAGEKQSEKRVEKKPAASADEKKLSPLELARQKGEAEKSD